MESLVVVYSSKKENQINTRGSIDAGLKAHGIITDLTSQPKEVGLLGETVQTERRVYRRPVFTYEWKMRLSSPVDATLLQALRKELRDVDVNDIYVENV